MNQDQFDVKTPEFVSLQFQLAGLGSRAAAFIIDQLILMVANIIILIIPLMIFIYRPTMWYFGEYSDVKVAIIVIVLFVINWGYFFAFEYFMGGRTFGKKMMGIRVIQENGHSITLLSSFIRNLLRIIDSLPTYYLLGILMVFFHSKHKRVGDLVAGTIVVHERKAKKQKKLSALEKEIAQRGLSTNNLVIDEWGLKSFDAKDWKLINTYANRFPELPLHEKTPLTKQVAEIIFPKVGLELEGKTEREVEDTLLVIYLILKEEWEYEL